MEIFKVEQPEKFPMTDWDALEKRSLDEWIKKCNKDRENKLKKHDIPNK